MKRNKSIFLASIIFLFVLFYSITSRSPIVGDAYNYANVGQTENPITLARLAYFSWSGRFFSELWGFFMCSKIDLWNFINPLFFVIIYGCMNFLGNKELSIIKMGLILVFMLSVATMIRTQTYTWIMGTTYIIPLMLSLIYFCFIKHYCFDQDKKIPIGIQVFLNCILFYTGLCMENIAGTVVLGILLFLIYQYCQKKKPQIGLWINLAISVISLLLLRLSPGANGRLAEYHPEWVEMTLLEKLTSNLKWFVKLTFTDNKVVVGGFILLLITLVLQRKSKKSVWVKSGLFIEGLALVFITIPNLSESIYQNGMNSLSYAYSAFWFLFIGCSFVLLFQFCDKNKALIVFFLTLGGASSICLMISPIFAARSLVYFVYYLMLCNLYLWDEIKIPQKIEVIITMIIIGFIVGSTFFYYRTYTYVARVQEERLQIIEYYKNNPQETEAWIPRISDEAIHSANIEDDNEYHMKTFKKYYGLPDSLKIIFYKEDN